MLGKVPTTLPVVSVALSRLHLCSEMGIFAIVVLHRFPSCRGLRWTVPAKEPVFRSPPCGAGFLSMRRPAAADWRRFRSLGRAS
jgi:hypothetical protein